MGILCGCQTEALLMALKSQQVGQQAGSDSDILAKVVVSLASHLPQPLSQLLGLHSVQCCLVQLQAIQLSGQGWQLLFCGPVGLFKKPYREKGLDR